MKIRKQPSDFVPETSSEDIREKLEYDVLLTVRTESSWAGFDNDEIKLVAFLATNEFFLIGQPCRSTKRYGYSLPRLPEQNIKVSEQWTRNIFAKFKK